MPRRRINMRGLGRELAELERTNPEVRAAAENYDRVRGEIIATSKTMRITAKSREIVAIERINAEYCPPERPFRVGDMVSRDGTDVHEVTEADDDGWGNIEVVCVRAPSSGWCKVGDVERNLSRRYEFVDIQIPQSRRP